MLVKFVDRKEFTKWIEVAEPLPPRWFIPCKNRSTNRVFVDSQEAMTHVSKPIYIRLAFTLEWDRLGFPFYKEKVQ